MKTGVDLNELEHEHNRMNVFCSLFLLSLGFLFHQSLNADEKTLPSNERVVPIRLANQDSDRLAAGFFSKSSPLFGLLERRSQNQPSIIDIFNWATSPNREAREIRLTFDGKLKNAIVLPREAQDSYGARQFLVDSSLVLPRIKSRLDSSGSDFFVVTSRASFRDPSTWSVETPDSTVRTAARETVSQFLEVMVCKTSGADPRPSPMIHLDNPSALSFVKSYRNSDDEHLVGFSIDKAKAKLPHDYAWCGEYTNLGDEDGALFLKVQTKAIFWAFQSKKRKPVFIGRGLPVDAGDYVGDGQSEFVFFAPANSISTHFVGDVKVFSSNFQKYLSFELGRF